MSDTTNRPEGSFVAEGDTEWFRIDHYDRLHPFLVTVVTSDDQWMYVSSSGALAAGRQSPQHSLFPYENDDRLHRAGGSTGPFTLIRTGGHVWEPFSAATPFGVVQRSIAKSLAGDQLRFSEHNPVLGLTFSYTWTTAGDFGIVRRCEITADPDRPPISVEVLDGLVNVLPAGVELEAQQTVSTLVDAYRRSELVTGSTLALFTLEALVTDKADPAEALLATTIWNFGLQAHTVILSEDQIRAFRSGASVEPEHLTIGRKGAYLVSVPFTITSQTPARWGLVADVGQDHVDISLLRHRLGSPEIESDLEAAIDEAHDSLLELVAAADGVQDTRDQRATTHHFANVLFNCMRGGSFTTDHRVEVAQVGLFIARRNQAVHGRFGPIADTLDPVVEIATLRASVETDADLSRLVNEYLPLTFSRRHGDPSRPWNRFEISARDADGNWALGYEGNWRDIFQNWDALMHSFPEYFETAIAKFLNASTLDGNNPYRITDEGIDWEVPEDGSWGNLGYWGDHQIVYLHRLLHSAQRFHPELLPAQLGRRTFSYGDVPYRIRSYAELIQDPKNTIDFDDQAHEHIENRVRQVGADGRLVVDGEHVHHASLAEKLLVPALSKLSNLVAGAGIWMNTQRPEWNDANNALVGNGVSTVTACHLREYLGGLDGLLAQAPVSELPIAALVTRWLRELTTEFEVHAHLTDPGAITAAGRRSLLDGIGTAFSDYRSEAYRAGPGPAEAVPVADLRRFIATVRPHLDAVVSTAARSDGLFDSYYLVDLRKPGIAEVEPLYVMLEGQVAALGLSGLDAGRAVELVHALYDSELFRPDQNSFVLYPNHRPVPFMEKNRVPVEAIGPAVTAVLESGRGLIRRDSDGVVRFASHLRSARHLDAELRGFTAEAREEFLAAYEATFDHHSFTGRSQTMYKYEGLGSIYWHMVSKLLFAIQEKLTAAAVAGVPDETISMLADQYRRVRNGLGYTKSVLDQGSFPTDPHSHTPEHLGAQQPGMTGQVKEGVLLRWGELGVHVADGCLDFRPDLLLDRSEFLEEPRWWEAIGETLEAGTLGFTYCGVPVVYTLGTERSCTAVWRNGGESRGEFGFDRRTSAALFSRTGQITRVDVTVDKNSLTSGA